MPATACARLFTFNAAALLPDMMYFCECGWVHQGIPPEKQKQHKRQQQLVSK